MLGRLSDTSNRSATVQLIPRGDHLLGSCEWGVYFVLHVTSATKGSVGHECSPGWCGVAISQQSIQGFRETPVIERSCMGQTQCN
jgi:hypothetical protein